MILAFPEELQRRILSLVSLTTLVKHYRSGLLGSDLSRLFESYVYENLYFGSPWAGNREHLSHDVSVEELQKLARGDIKCDVRSLKIFRPMDKMCLERNDFADFCRDNAEFLTTIQNIEFDGDHKSYKRLNVSNLPSVKKISVHSFPEKVGTVPIPPNVESVCFIAEEEAELELHKWPSLLRHLELHDHGEWSPGIDYSTPANLKSFKSRGAYNFDYPKNLYRYDQGAGHQEGGLYDFESLMEILESSGKDAFRSLFHIGLSELKISTPGVYSLDFLQNVPNLRKLCVKYGNFALQNVSFPENLEVLELPQNNLKSLKGVQFPSTLKELDVSDNGIARFDDANFPNLQRLNISKHRSVSYPSVITLPETLVHLQAQKTRLDWAAVKFPKLKSMEICCRSVKDLELPQTLQTLDLCLDPWNYQGEDICLPPGLIDLTLKAAGNLDWDCCNFRANHEAGRERESSPKIPLSHLKIPKSVKRAKLYAFCKEQYRDLVLPDGLEELVSDFPITNLPQNIVWLEIKSPNVGLERLNLPNLISFKYMLLDEEVDLRGMPNLEFLEGTKLDLYDTLNCKRLRIVSLAQD